MELVHHFQWTSSVRCPNHNKPANVVIDQKMPAGVSHIEIAGCCGEFTGLVEKKLKGVVKASFHTMVWNGPQNSVGDWISKLPARES